MQLEKPLMKENETLLMLDSTNQRMGERSLAGTPQLEVRKQTLEMR